MLLIKERFEKPRNQAWYKLKRDADFHAPQKTRTVFHRFFGHILGELCVVEVGFRIAAVGRHGDTLADVKISNHIFAGELIPRRCRDLNGVHLDVFSREDGRWQLIAACIVLFYGKLI